MIRKLEMLYPSISTDVLCLCLDNAEHFVRDYCNLDECPYELDTLLIAMVKQDINKFMSEGYTSENIDGVSVSYSPDYTPDIYKRLKRYRRIRTVQ